MQQSFFKRKPSAAQLIEPLTAPNYMPPSAIADRSNYNTTDQNLPFIRSSVQGASKSGLKRDLTRVPRFTINDDEQPMTVSDEAASPSPAREPPRKSLKQNRHDR